MDPLVRHYSHINFISQTSSDFNFASPPPGQMSRPSASENGKVLSYLGTAVRVGFGNRPIQEDVHRNIFSLLKVKISGVGSCALDRPFQMCKRSCRSTHA